MKCKLYISALFVIISIAIFSVNIVFAEIGSVIHSFPTPGGKPTGLTWDGQNLWVADIGTNRIYKIDSQTGVVLSSFASPQNSVINGLAWDGTNLWCTDNGDANRIYQLNILDGSILRTIQLNTGSPRGLTFDGVNLWYQDSAEKTIYKLDLQSGTVLKSFTSPGGYNRGLAWDGKYLWSTDRDKNEFYLIDTLRQSVFQIINAPGAYSYGITFDGGYIWNVDYDTDTIYKIQVTGIKNEKRALRPGIRNVLQTDRSCRYRLRWPG